MTIYAANSPVSIDISVSDENHVMQTKLKFASNRTKTALCYVCDFHMRVIVIDTKRAE